MNFVSFNFSFQQEMGIVIYLMKLMIPPYMCMGNVKNIWSLVMCIGYEDSGKAMFIVVE